jgi:hypothetical protein
MILSAIQSAVAPETTHEVKGVPTPEDLKVTRLVLAVQPSGPRLSAPRQGTAKLVASGCANRRGFGSTIGVQLNKHVSCVS